MLSLLYPMGTSRRIFALSKRPARTLLAEVVELQTTQSAWNVGARASLQRGGFRNEITRIWSNPSLDIFWVLAKCQKIAATVELWTLCADGYLTTMVSRCSPKPFVVNSNWDTDVFYHWRHKKSAILLAFLLDASCLPGNMIHNQRHVHAATNYQTLPGM